MSLLLEGKRAFITGGTRGIGAAMCEIFAREGADVAFSYNSRDDLAAEMSQKIEAHGRRAFNAKVSVVDRVGMKKMTRELVEKWGGIDILVNNAGVGWFGSVESQGHDEWRRVMDTNVTGIFNCCKAVIPHLRRRGGGYIINISSLAGSNPFAGGASYCASKAAVDVFSEALMQEVRHDGIRVSYIKPGSVNTDFMSEADPTNEWKLRPEDVAQTVVDLVSHDTRSLPSRVDMRPSRPPKT